MPTAPTRLMALDFGLAMIGVAVGERNLESVEPLGALKAKKGRPAWRQLDGWIKQWAPQRLIIGLPLHMSGDESPMSQRARGFATELQQRYQLPCELSDERLSTDEARQLWDGQDKSQLQGLSAAVILHDWIRRHPLAAESEA